MNNSTTADITLLLEAINREKAQQLLPAIIYVSILMVTGLLGNLMVCYYYCFKTKTTPSSVFIVSLGIYDLTVCCIFMPTEIADIAKFYTFENNAACKVLRFVNFFTGMGSVLTLVAISVDRYKHIPRSQSKQLTLTQARRICALVVMAAVLLSLPTIFIYDSLPITIPNKYGLHLNGSNCMLTDKPAYRPYVWAFNGLQFLCFVIFTTVLTVLYGIVGHTIYKHRQRMSQYKLSKAFGPEVHRTLTRWNPNANHDQNRTSDTTTSSSINMQQSKSDNSIITSVGLHSLSASTDSKGGEEANISQSESNDNHVNRESMSRPISTISIQSGSNFNNDKNETSDNHSDQTENSKRRGDTNMMPKLRGHDPGNFNRETVQITLVMIAVTGLFMVSMLPYLCLTVWRIYQGKHEAEFLSDQGLLAFKIVSRSYLLNSSLNPWIYGVFNSKFRRYYYTRLCCRTE